MSEQSQPRKSDSPLHRFLERRRARREHTALYEVLGEMVRLGASPEQVRMVRDAFRLEDR